MHSNIPHPVAGTSSSPSLCDWCGSTKLPMLGVTTSLQGEVGYCPNCVSTVLPQLVGAASAYLGAGYGPFMRANLEGYTEQRYVAGYNNALQTMADRWAQAQQEPVVDAEVAEPEPEAAEEQPNPLEDAAVRLSMENVELKKQLAQVQHELSVANERLKRVSQPVGLVDPSKLPWLPQPRPSEAS